MMTKVFSKKTGSFIKKLLIIGTGVWVVSSVFSIYWTVSLLIIGVLDWFFGVLLKDKKSFLF
jgi:hypothetical protein